MAEACADIATAFADKQAIAFDEWKRDNEVDIIQGCFFIRENEYTIPDLLTLFKSHTKEK